MDSQKVLSEAWQITLKNKYLWVFGFVAGLTFGSQQIGVNLLQGGGWLFQDIENILSRQGLTAILVGVVSTLLWILGLIARASLIKDVSTGIEPSGSLSRVTGVFRTSSRFLGFLVLMQLLVWSPIIVLNVLFSIWARPFVESFASNFQAGAVPDFTSVMPIWIAGLAVPFLTIPLLFLDAFSYRSIVIEDLGVIDGLKRAYGVIRRNLGAVLGLSILCVLIGLIFSFAVSILLSPTLFAIMPLMRQTLLECSMQNGDLERMHSCMQRLESQPLFIGLSLLTRLISAAVSSVWVTFQSSAFTLAYLKLVKKD